MTEPASPGHFAFRAQGEGHIVWPGDRMSGRTSSRARCVFGRSGLVAAELKREGDGATPAGVWPMRRVFFRPDRIQAPVSRLPVIAIAPDMGWCDDPASPAYNTLVTLPCLASHERMRRDDRLYDLVVELGYNDAPAIAGRGSAIFLHVASPDWTPTEGCVATDLSSLQRIVLAAGPDDSLAIVG